MTQNEIIKLCNEKEQELLDKYFGNLVHEAAIEMPETIGEYTKDLPLNIEAEYREFLEGIWELHAPLGLQGTPLVLEEQKLRAEPTHRYDGTIGAIFSTTLLAFSENSY